MQHLYLPRRTESTMIFAANKDTSCYLVQVLDDMLEKTRDCSGYLFDLRMPSRILNPITQRGVNNSYREERSMLYC